MKNKPVTFRAPQGYVIYLPRAAPSVNKSHIPEVPSNRGLNVSEETRPQTHLQIRTLGACICLTSPKLASVQTALSEVLPYPAEVLIDLIS